MTNFIKKWRWVSLALVWLIFACYRESKPTRVEGQGTVHIQLDMSPANELAGAIFSPESIRIELKSSLVNYQGWTDSSGAIRFERLISASYIIGFSKELNDNRMLGGGGEFQLESYQVIDTVLPVFLIRPGLKINEIFAAWSANDILYYHDQFYELYNASDDTVWLDGMVVIRGGGSNQALQDLDGDGELETFTTIWRFPGEPVVDRAPYFRARGDYPVAPRQYLLLASDARNHQEYVPNSIDLSGADWEFVNRLDYADLDNPMVPNIFCIQPDKRYDFMIAGTSDILLLCTGEDAVPDENPLYPGGYLDGIALETIIDGVEYRSSATSLKVMDARVDKGFTGVGISTYSGKSMQRIKAGFDTDNSSIDFEILDAPTPGRQE